MQSVLLQVPIADGDLINAFFRYIDTFEMDAIKSIMNGECEQEMFVIAVGVFSWCQSIYLSTKENIHEMVINSARR